MSGLTFCVTGAGAGVDSAWEQRKLEARKMLENAAESPAFSARFLGWRFVMLDSLSEKKTNIELIELFLQAFIYGKNQKLYLPKYYVTTPSKVVQVTPCHENAIIQDLEVA